ncbi:MAG: hypothetical protein HWE30_13085 [Methylocystaceae bacterium]|nr:hypothetical protein [Methylocystaceae bacterium]
MIFHPVILALLLGSLISTLMILIGAVFGSQILRQWNLSSGSQKQLNMERRTYLISTFLMFALISELLSLLLYVYNAEQMSVQFVGAMCAVGTLNANIYGFPTLIAKIILFFCAALWLMINHADNQAHDYPLIRWKYGFLIAILPIALSTAGLQLSYFLNLETDVITSCCSKLFTPDGDNVTAEMAGLDEAFALGLFYVCLALFFIIGLRFYLTKHGHRLFALASAVLFIASITAVISVISLYVYEHPHHHCPFCLLKPEYNYIGYAIYLPLFVGTALGTGAGTLASFVQIPSLQETLTGFVQRLTLASLISILIFAGIVSGAIYLSALRLF